VGGLLAVPICFEGSRGAQGDKIGQGWLGTCA
jgi:hypothetical protein